MRMFRYFVADAKRVVSVQRGDSLFLHLFHPLLLLLFLDGLLYLRLKYYYYLCLNYYYFFHSRACCYNVEDFDVARQH